MAESMILDHRGQPLRKRDLTKEVAAPTLTGIRHSWNPETMASGLTPDRLAGLLMEANISDGRNYLTLAEEMEERYPHYASVLGTRKLAVSGLEPVVEAASDDAAHVKQADAVRALVARPEFGEMVFDALDGLGKGYSAIEIMWSRGAQWVPEAYLWRDPRFFRFDPVDATRLRLLTDENTYPGDPLPPYKFIVHRAKLKSGIPLRGGLARVAAAAYMCWAYSLTDWVAFAEVFGMPLRLGRYGPGASEDDIRKLISAVANLGSDAAAVLPQGMQIDFQEAGNRTGGGDLFTGLAEYLDKAVSKAVLGQTATPEGTVGRLGNEQAQAEVREDLQVADAGALCNTLNRDLIKPFIDLNYGPQTAYPRLTLPVVESEDLTALAKNLEVLVPLGIRVEASWARDKFGIPDPSAEAELLSAPASAPAAGSAMNRALNATSTATQTVVDSQIDQAQQQGDAAVQQWVEKIRAIVEQADSMEDLRDQLLAQFNELDPQQFGRVMGEAMLAAAMAGRFDVTQGQ